MSQNIFRNPFVSTQPALSLSSVGDGTLTVDRLSHFTVNQDYTVICSAIAPFTVFNIIGNLDGAVGVAVVGQQFTDEDNKIFITIQQGPTLFQIGDTFNFSVTQGTDVNQQNIDSYDELPQKNFGTGITGFNLGDHNIRFSPNPQPASKTLGDLKFDALFDGPDGNAISLEYILGTQLQAASLDLQSLNFLANDEGEDGNLISMEYEDYFPGVLASKFIQDIEYTADAPGLSGNNISIRYTTGATAGNEIVTVVGSAITVQIQSGVSTVNQIQIQIALHPVASLLIDTNETGTGLEPQVAVAATFLENGEDPIGTAGNEVVTVVGNAIKVKMQSGVSTAEDIQLALTSNIDSISLISTTIIGTPGSVQIAPVAPTFLSGGTEEVGAPGNEIVNVIDNNIQVTFIDGLSTAQEIKTALDANLDVANLVTVSLLGIGTELQSNTPGIYFLGGGRLSGSFAFNTSELTTPLNFFEGNAPIIHNGQTNQGNELTLGETIKKGKVTLDDDDALNISGPSVLNTQKTINNIIQNGKLFLKTEDNSKVVWEKPLLTFASDILIVLPETGIINRITTANSPISINDGEHVWVQLSRLVNANLTIQTGTSVPTGENILRLFSRIGEDLIWYDNTLQRDKKKIRIGEGGGGGTAYQEKIGTGNGAATSFPLTFIPSNEFSILVVCSYIRTNVVDYNYNVIGNQIVFTSAPAAGQDVYVFYLTDGESLVVPTPSGLLNSYTHTITNAEELAKEIVLINTPASPSKILVDVIGGGAQEYNIDFNISINLFQWSGFALDGLLAENDKIRFYFYS